MAYRPLPLLLTAAASAIGGILLTACTGSEIIHTAGSRDPAAAVERLTRARVDGYRTNPTTLVNDIQRARRQFKQVAALLSGEVSREWGRDEVLLPTNKRYVKYTQNYKSRAIIQFDRGRVTVETLDERTPLQSLHRAIVTTLLTPDDPRAVDLYSDKTVRLSGTPYLHGLVRDHQGAFIDTPERAEAFARHLVEKRRKSRTLDTEAGRKKAHYVRLQMVNDHQNRQARRYAPYVEKYAKQFQVSPSLVYAVMKTESSFNPYAVSTAPAYGLMQLVPTTGGRDAYRSVKGYDHTPSKEYLFIPENNIELGTAYLSIIDQRYLGGIANPTTREYCTIAAYNGGAGNVLTLFSEDRKEAVVIINRLSPAEVYRRLREEHPRHETRRYLGKVLAARKEFVTA